MDKNKALTKEMTALEKDLAAANRLATQLRAKRREVLKVKKLASLPSYLRHVQRRHWAATVASGIHQGYLGKCCLVGCVHCGFIGWRRIKRGTIVNLDAPFRSTGEYAVTHNVSLKTVTRRCDEGSIASFKLPDSHHRYIVG